MIATNQLAHEVGVRKACDALTVPRATYYRQRKREATTAREAAVTRSSPRAL